MTLRDRLTRPSTRIYALSFLLLLALWGMVWALAAAQYRNTLEDWIAAGRDAGYDITYDDARLFGFPRHVVMRFTNLRWKNADGILFSAGDIDIGAELWQHQFFHAKFKGRAEINAPLIGTEQSLILSGTTGRAEVEIDREGFWTFSRITMNEADIGRNPDYMFHAEHITISGKRPALAPRNHSETGLTLEGQAENVTLPSAISHTFGADAKSLEITLRVMDAVPDFRKKESVAAWNNDSGVVEFDKLNIEWGALHMAAKGTVGFDDDLQPEGAFASTLGNHEAVIKALTDNGFIGTRQEDMLHTALRLFAKPSHEDGIDGIQVPIAIQLGGLYLGPVKIFTFPQIEWR